MNTVQRWHEPDFSHRPVALHVLPVDRDPQARAAAIEAMGLGCLQDDWRSIYDKHVAVPSLDAWRDLARKVEKPGCVEVRRTRALASLTPQRSRRRAGLIASDRA